MSKLDEAFLKAYAKDRGAATRVRTPVAPTELPRTGERLAAEAGERVAIQSDAQTVVRCDPPADNAAALASRSAGGRLRGSAVPSTMGPSIAGTSSFGTQYDDQRAAHPPASNQHPPTQYSPHQHAGTEHAASQQAARTRRDIPEDSTNAVPVMLSFDSPQTLVGPHYQSVSLDLGAFDLFAPAPPAPRDAADAMAWNDTANATETLPEQRAVTATEPTAEAPLRSVDDRAERLTAEVFQPVWEVDRFDYDETVRELCGPTSPLRTAGRQLQHACSEGLKVLAVTSPLREQGRSTLAVSLARLVAEGGLRVLLLDGDLDRPAIADKLRLEVQMGWDEALRTRVPVEEVAVHSVEDRFAILPLIAPQHPDPERPSAEDTAAMFRQFRRTFDLVIIDTGNLDIVGSWIPGAEAPGGVDAALVIEDARGEDITAQQSCLRKLKEFGIENVGMVENFTD